VADDVPALIERLGGRLAVRVRDDTFADDVVNREVAAHVARMRNAADRNYLASLKCLALIRKAAPAVTVTINKTVNMNRKDSGTGPVGGRLAGVIGAGRN
jgi:hypothetical protein